MKIGFIGRSEVIFNSIKLFLKKKIKVGFVYTCKAEDYYKKNESDLKKLCEEHEINYFCDTKINLNMEKLKKIDVKIVFSINYKIKLSKEVINSFKFGVYNAHLGDLPKYRGNATPNWAIIKEEKRIPVTIHKMSDKIDEGFIVNKIFFKITNKTYIGDIYNWLNTTTPNEFYKLYLISKKNKIFFRRQIGKPLISYPRKEIDSQIFWNSSSTDIFNLVRASSTPFKGAYCYFNKKKIRILKCKIYKPNFDYLAVPGQVCLNLNNNPVIATKDKMIEIIKMSESNKEDLKLKKQILKSFRNRLN